MRQQIDCQNAEGKKERAHLETGLKENFISFHKLRISYCLILENLERAINSQ